MSNMKNVSLIAASVLTEANERHRDIDAVIASVDEELLELSQIIREINDRLDKLEAGGTPVASD